MTYKANNMGQKLWFEQEIDWVKSHEKIFYEGNKHCKEKTEEQRPRQTNKKTVGYITFTSISGMDR